MAKKILIVEDNAQDQKILKIHLIRQGFENLVFASTGEEGLSKAKIEKPDLIILDMNLPQLNGVQVDLALSMDPATKEIPVLFNSNLLKADQLSPSANNRFLVKSSNPTDLVKAVERIFSA